MGGPRRPDELSRWLSRVQAGPRSDQCNGEGGQGRRSARKQVLGPSFPPVLGPYAATELGAVRASSVGQRPRRAFTRPVDVPGPAAWPARSRGIALATSLPRRTCSVAIVRHPKPSRPFLPHPRNKGIFAPRLRGPGINCAFRLGSRRAPWMRFECLVSQLSVSQFRSAVFPFIASKVPDRVCRPRSDLAKASLLRACSGSGSVRGSEESQLRWRVPCG